MDLIGGGGDNFWPRPGRIFAAARSHTFAQLATAIDDAIARWNRAHLHQFQLTDGLRIGRPDDWDIDAEQLIDGRRTSLARLRPGEQFVYELTSVTADPPVHVSRPASTAHRTRYRSRPPDALLGLGNHPRPIRPPLGHPTVTKTATRDPTPDWPTSRRCGPGGGHNPNANLKPQQRTA